MKNLAFVFPGQGSQSVGMLADLYESYPQIQHHFARATDVLDVDLWEMISLDANNQLNKTEFTQPALLTASVALWQLWQEKSEIKPLYLAGHSLGEYSALVCAGSIQFEDAVRLTHKRGQYMQQAVPAGTGAMAAIIGLTDEEVIAVCQDDNVTAANFNAPGQVVISGTKQAVEVASDLAKQAGAKRVMPLAVSVPSHCELMRPAAQQLAEDLLDVEIKTPLIPVLQNVDAKPHQSPEKIKTLLVEQLYKSVLWTQSNQYFAEHGIDTVVECGPNKVLVGLAKRFNRKWNIHNLGTSKGFEKALSIGKES